MTCDVRKHLLLGKNGFHGLENRFRFLLYQLGKIFNNFAILITDQEIDTSCLANYAFGNQLSNNF